LVIVNHLMHERDIEKCMRASERSYFSYSNTGSKVYISEVSQAVPARPSGKGTLGQGIEFCEVKTTCRA
jgi:hypothetical protein